MEKRKARMIVNRSGSGNSTFRATLPNSWIRQMGLSEDNRNLKLEFDGKVITIKNNEEEIKMLERLLGLARVKIEKEIDRLGYIDDSDNNERYLDNLAKELAEKELLQGSEDLDLYYEKEQDIEELSETLLEEIKDKIMKNYNHKGSTNDRGNYSGCYYKDKEGFKKWNEFGE